MTTGIIIPASMASRRFPGKPLADVGGKPLLSYAVEAARESGLPFVVATQDQSVFEWFNNEFGVASISSSWFSDSRNLGITFTGDFRNGTERAAHVNVHVTKWDRVIVLQCDEPDLTAEDLILLSNATGPCTLVSDPAESDWGNQNSVFAEMVLTMVAQFIRGANKQPHMMRHVGAYIYDADILNAYLDHFPTPAEQVHSLEQLRTMAMGYAWQALNVGRPLRSVNVPSDVEAFK